MGKNEGLAMGPIFPRDYSQPLYQSFQNLHQKVRTMKENSMLDEQLVSRNANELKLPIHDRVSLHNVFNVCDVCHWG